MKKKLTCLLIFIGLLNTSFTQEPRTGILTAHDYEEGVALYSLHDYWYCFPREMISYHCDFIQGDSHGGDENAKMGQAILEVRGSGIYYFYFARRPWPLDACEWQLAKWDLLMDKTETVCLAGDLGFESREEILSGQRAGALNRIKTINGCYSYFLSEECPPLPYKSWKECEDSKECEKEPEEEPEVELE